MKKFLLTCGIILGLCSQASAQSNDEMWHYWGNDYTMALEELEEVGVPGVDRPNTGDTIRLALYIPNNFKDCTVKKVRFVSRDRRAIRKISVWTTPKLNYDHNIGHQFENTQVVPLEDVKFMNQDSTYTEIALANPVVVPEGGLFLGYDQILKDSAEICKLRAYQYPLLDMLAPASDPDRLGKTYYWASSSDPWIDFARDAASYAPIQALITTDKAIRSAAHISENWSNPLTLIRNEEGTVNATITSEGVLPITSIGYTVKDMSTDKVSEERSLTLESPLRMGWHRTLTLTVGASDYPAISDMELTITKVNGEANQATEKMVSKGQMTTLDHRATRRVLMEEGTGAWCMWCPRGMVGIEKMKEKYPQTFVAVSYHNGDDMVCWDVDEFWNEIWVDNNPFGYPTSLLDRTRWADPYTGSAGTAGGPLDIEKDFLALSAIPPHATIDITNFEVKDNVAHITTQSSFLCNSETAPYGIVYVVVADSLTCPDDQKFDPEKWKQVNAYSGNSADIDPNMAYFCEADDPIEDFEFNDVAYACAGSYEGVEGSVTAPLVVGTPQTFTGEVVLSGHDLPVPDVKNLRAIAFIVDNRDHKVVNAAQWPVPESGINNVEVDNSVNGDVKYYDLMGRQVVNPQGGIFIRQQGNKATKVVK